jgi:signal transduction histidine kinase/ActR/RegA family two-component response regulator
MPAIRRRSLLWKYTIHFGGLVSVLLVASGALGGYFAYREATAALESIQQTRAHFAATEIANFVHGLQDALQRIVTKLDTIDHAEPEHVRLELVALMRYHAEISDLLWDDGRGGGRLDLSRHGIEAAKPQATVHDEPLRTRDAKGNLMGPVYFRQQTEPYLTVAAVSPRGAVLEAEVNLRYVWDVIQQAQPTPGGVIYVVDRRGRLISHPDTGLVLAQTDLSKLPQVRRALDRDARAVGMAGEARDLQGHAVVSTAAPVEALGWTVFAERPLHHAFRPVYASAARSVALIVIGVAAAVAASLLLARRMVQPIREIEARARRLGEGEFEQPVHLQDTDELDSLATQFNWMAVRLRETHATLESRITERTRDLSLANEAKTRFIAAASHDLRQPIHALALFVGELKATELPAQASALADRIDRSVVALQALLEALLDLSRLDVGAVTVEPRHFPLQELLAGLTAQFAPVASAKGLALVQVRTSVWVRSDPLLLERILLNLISNALQYTHRGRIVVGCRRRRDGVEVVVADTGIGIAPEQLPKIFEEFYRAAPARGEAHVGLGLGLAIVKRLALLLDHPLRIDSVPGKGTAVRLLLPQVEAGAPSPLAAPRSALNIDDILRGCRLLVIDDEADARDAMCGLLARWGCEVQCVATGDEAMALVRAWPPDVVVCDVRLAAGERGMDVVDRLEAACRPPAAFAFVTGESAPGLLAEVRATGHVLLFKPTPPGKLRAAIEHLVRTAADRRPATRPDPG